MMLNTQNRLTSMKPTNIMESFLHHLNVPSFSADKDRRTNLKKKVMNDDPIQIHSDEEEKELMQKFTQESHLKHEVTKAQLTGSTLQLVLAIAKHLVPGSLAEKELQINKFILQFFAEKAKINLQSGYFCERIDNGLYEGDPTQVYEDKYLLFGVDLLSTRMINSIYNQYNPHIEWIDSSHSLISFKNHENGIEFVRNSALDKSADLTSWESNSNVLAKSWIQLNSYFELICVRRLFVRNFTKADEQYIAKRPKFEESYNVYLGCKIQLEESLKQDNKIGAILGQVYEQQRIKMLLNPKYRFKKHDKRQHMNNYRHGEHNNNRYNRNSRQQINRDMSRSRERKRFMRRDSYKTYDANNRDMRNTEYPNRPNNFNNYYHNKSNFQNIQVLNSEIRSNVQANAENQNEVSIIENTQCQQNNYNSLNKSQINQQLVPHINSILNSKNASESNSEVRGVQSQLKKFHLNSSEFSSIGERSKHQISNVNQFGFDSNHASSSYNNISSRHQHISSNQMSNSGFSLQSDNPDFESGFIFNVNRPEPIKTIKRETIAENDDESEQQLLNILSKPKDNPSKQVEQRKRQKSNEEDYFNFDD